MCGSLGGAQGEGEGEEGEGERELHLLNQSAVLSAQQLSETQHKSEPNSSHCDWRNVYAVCIYVTTDW